MRLSSAAAALLAPAVAGGLGLPAAAAPARTGPPPQARAAWVTACELPVEGTSPCGPWHLLLRDGRTVTVGDSAVRAKDRATSLFALSGDGRTIVYQRARDHRLVVRAAAGGPVRELPRSLRPGPDDALHLSPAGDRVLVGRPGRVEVLTLATGRITGLTVKGEPAGFSGDGDEVLTTRDLSDGTEWLYSYGLDGRALRSPAPQFVAHAVTLALSPDGHTVAAFSSGGSGRGGPPRMRTYDLETARLSDGVNLPLTGDTPPDHACWTPDGRLAAYSYDSSTTKSTVVRVLTVDPASGQARRSDTYKVGPDPHTIVFPGQ
ncbi:hypothetical protein [Nonomuraea sp. NPDC049684]|uniref:hypothetical protein n=1 Tax=Nonomuraea sp. NPDC049684 TaxID=3364356 RepID=UPI00378DE171